VSYHGRLIVSDHLHVVTGVPISFFEPCSHVVHLRLRHCWSWSRQVKATNQAFGETPQPPPRMATGFLRAAPRPCIFDLFNSTFLTCSHKCTEASFTYFNYTLRHASSGLEIHTLNASVIASSRQVHSVTTTAEQTQGAVPLNRGLYLEEFGVPGHSFNPNRLHRSSAN